MRVDVITKEYPPNVYGGAGVHVVELVKALRQGVEVQVRAFGEVDSEADTTGYPDLPQLDQANATLRTLGVDVTMAQDVAGADVVHSHTWYANAAGQLAQMLHGVPHVLTAHSLEPLRPWKAEQLGGGYRVSSWIERQAYETADRVIAVSDGMRRDILRSYPSIDESKVEVVYNGIDLEGWQRVDDAELVRGLGIDPDRPSVVFVGRITRQKGLPYLLRAAKLLPADVQLVLCAGAPDTPEIMAEVTGLVRELQEERTGVVWIDTVLPRHQLSAVLSQATTFVCPSVYEPLGIVNLEAMACGVPVVGSDTGGIPEVVADGLTGRIVPLEQVQDGTGTPVDPDRFVADLAATLTEVVSDPALARLMGRAGRMRAEEEFSWSRIAEQTLRIYQGLLN
ncbi:glycogen synthase [Frigoribacterium sp. VKM Ac-2836]|uniref:glycogen synthase n=1 Tax=Frigoribacterium sp. VKM Ac-2836 TaxID=2739014 RepID=UPI001564604A|nr:glycogen synthase [Frigoribacterium sp. VKM Ac-2836]